MEGAAIAWRPNPGVGPAYPIGTTPMKQSHFINVVFREASGTSCVAARAFVSRTSCSASVPLGMAASSGPPRAGCLSRFEEQVRWPPGSCSVRCRTGSGAFGPDVRSDPSLGHPYPTTPPVRTLRREPGPRSLVAASPNQ
jgi:hypothetical protein